MNRENVIQQLEQLKEHCSDMVRTNEENECWKKDSEALKSAIDIIKNRVWPRIFNEWISCYNSIECLATNGIIDEEQAQELSNNLLDEIIETIKSEV